VTETLFIPAIHSGLVVGRHGHTINGFQKASGAEISLPKVDEAVQEDGQRCVWIKGTPPQIEKCRKLILDHIAHREGGEHPFNPPPSMPRMPGAWHMEASLLHVPIPPDQVIHLFGGYNSRTYHEMEASGSRVFLVDMSGNGSSPEVLVAGSKEQKDACITIISGKIALPVDWMPYTLALEDPAHYHHQHPASAFIPIPAYASHFTPSHGHGHMYPSFPMHGSPPQDPRFAGGSPYMQIPLASPGMEMYLMSGHYPPTPPRPRHPMYHFM